ncbi:carboxypeptidase-like regulatory domain-containing protein [Mangrovimonas xylaniphaga]|uniref:carboxypeptidase-like regulatory domain-containing protein n=1 Tax=Mangrovimonas xylaniphaga TaxID=1645915 RepID=UPI0006B694EF|nr:carboxypeptidase-like regulatory domain-containing protein [Mangrovimonas xylaniphaga]
MFRIFVLICILSSNLASSQTLKGKVYDAETTVKGAKIININKNHFTYTNDNGDFNLKATPGDTLTFHSLFHESQQLVLKPNHFKETIVIELKKVTNTLDEIIIIVESEKVFDSTKFQSSLHKQLKTKKSNFPFTYSDSYTPTIDLIKLGKLVSELFKRKQVDTAILYASYEDFNELFSSNSYFNDKFLKKELQIPLEHKYLFFEYLDAQNISKSLLKSNNNFLLLDALLKHGESFGELLQETKP